MAMPVDNSDPIISAQKDMESHGFIASPIFDGKLHRFYIEGKKKAGWFCFFGDGVPAGSYGNWATDEKYKWCLKKESELNPFERAEFLRNLEKSKKEREKLSGQEPTKSPASSQTYRNEQDIIRDFQARKREKRRNLLVAITVLIFCIWAYSSGSTSSNNTAASSSSVTDEGLTNWIPPGFNSWSDDPNVSWRWLENDEYECDYDRACSGIMIIARSGCDSNLYAEVSILDKDNVQIGYTNDTLSSALSMEESKLIFNTYEENADTFRLSKISCY
jgi:hypothetical protein